jgi:hypothetical protein
MNLHLAPVCASLAPESAGSMAHRTETPIKQGAPVSRALRKIQTGALAARGGYFPLVGVNTAPVSCLLGKRCFPAPCDMQLDAHPVRKGGDPAHMGINGGVKRPRSRRPSEIQYTNQSRGLVLFATIAAGRVARFTESPANTAYAALW